MGRDHQRTHSSQRCRALLVGAMAVVAAACGDGLDTSEATLDAPATLPQFAAEPVEWARAVRARELLAEGEILRGEGEFKASMHKLTEAVTLDPSFADAHLALARTWLAAGRGSVAMALLEQLADDLPLCGTCIEALQTLRTDPALAGLASHARGRALLARVQAEPLAYEEWALQVATSLKSGKGERIPLYTHPRQPFDLVRSCPDCEVTARRAPTTRQLLGPAVGLKLSARFDVSDPRLGGVPLQVAANPVCAARCCRYPIAASVATKTSALASICFRPVSRDRAALTRVEIIYGPGH